MYLVSCQPHTRNPKIPATGVRAVTRRPELLQRPRGLYDRNPPHAEEKAAVGLVGPEANDFNGPWAIAVTP